MIGLLSDVAAEGRLIALEGLDLKRRDLARYLRAGAWTPTSAAIVAVRRGAVVGQLSAITDKGIYHRNAEIGMSVAKDSRRAGIGTGLLSSAVQWAKAFGLTKLCLNVFPHNEPALALYRSFGFTEEGLRRRHAKLSYGYEDLIEMAYFL